MSYGFQRYRPLRTIRGYAYLGPFGWPLPRAIVLRDRATGVDYLLSHDRASDTIVLTTPLPPLVRALPEEPVLASPIGGLRLYVENGTLFREEVPDAEDTRVDEPLFTLNYSDRRTTYLITADEVRATGDPLCLERWDGLGLSLTKTSLGCNFLVEEVAVSVFEEGVFESGVFV